MKNLKIIKRLILVIHLSLVLITGAMSGTVHTAWGYVYNQDGSVPANENIIFTAYITSRPNEIQTESSTGCGYENGSWYVGVGNFPTDWTPGEILHVDVTDTIKNEIGAVEVELTDAGSDQAEDLHLIISSISFWNKNKLNNFNLYQNYPNPFNPSTTIRYLLPKSGNVELIIYNLLGQKVRTLVNTHQTAGQYNVQWNGQDEQGTPLASGVYVYKLKVKDVSGNIFKQVKKMLYVK